MNEHGLDWVAVPLGLVGCVEISRVSIDAPVPALRGGQGGVVGAARHAAARIRWRPGSVDGEKTPSIPGYLIVDSWVLFYETGDFNSLHTDRPDSDATALLALDDNAGPLTVVPELTGASSRELLAAALRNPHPPGDAVQLSRDRFLVLPARMPHHRAPTALGCKVLSVSLVRQE